MGGASTRQGGRWVAGRFISDEDTGKLAEQWDRAHGSQIGMTATGANGRPFPAVGGGDNQAGDPPDCHDIASRLTWRLVPLAVVCVMASLIVNGSASGVLHTMVEEAVWVCLGMAVGTAATFISSNTGLLERKTDMNCWKNGFISMVAGGTCAVIGGAVAVCCIAFEIPLVGRIAVMLVLNAVLFVNVYYAIQASAAEGAEPSTEEDSEDGEDALVHRRRTFDSEIDRIRNTELSSGPPSLAAVAPSSEKEGYTPVAEIPLRVSD